MSAQATMSKPIPSLPSLDYGVGAGIAILLAGLIGFGLAKAGAVPLQMELYGETGPIDVEQVRTTAMPFLGDGFFAIAVPTMEAQLRALPWVKRAQVERLWPDRVAIHLDSYVALARWGSNAVLTTDGSLVYSDDLPALDLQIVGPDKQAHSVFTDLADVQAGLPAAWQLQRWEVSETGDRQAVIAIDGHPIRVEFGREPVADKFKLLATTVLPVLTPRLAELAAVDMRYRNGFAVRWLTDAKSGVKSHE